MKLFINLFYIIVTMSLYYFIDMVAFFVAQNSYGLEYSLLFYLLFLLIVLVMLIVLDNKYENFEKFITYFCISYYSIFFYYASLTLYYDWFQPNGFCQTFILNSQIHSNILFFSLLLNTFFIFLSVKFIKINFRFFIILFIFIIFRYIF